MKPTNQRGEHVGIWPMIIVPRTIEIGRHPRIKAVAVLASVILREFKAGDFSDAIGFIRRLEGTREQTLLLQGLRRELRVDTGAPQEQQPPYAGLVSRVDRIGRHDQIFVSEFGGTGIVRVDTTNFGRGDNRDIRLFDREETINRRLVDQVELSPSPQHQFHIRLALEAAHQGAANHSPVACDVEFHQRRLRVQLATKGVLETAGSSAI